MPLPLQAPPGGEDLWHTHRLVCLDKGGGAIRPILIGMIWAKLLSHLLSATGQVRLGSLSPRQAIRDWHPPREISDDHCPESALIARHPANVVACLDFTERTSGP